MKKGILIIFLLAWSTAFAGIDVVYNELDFELNNYGVDWCLLPGSNYVEGADTVAVKLEIQFTGSSHVDGTLSTITSNITYDDTYWEFLGVEVDGWLGDVTCVSCGSGSINLEFDGQSMTPPTTLTSMAVLYFRSLCQADGSSDYVEFNTSANNQATVTYAGPTSETFLADTDAGAQIRVIQMSTWFLIDCYNDAIAPMGDTADVNLIYSQSQKYYLHTADIEIDYSTDSLTLLGVTYNSLYFDVGHNSSYTNVSGTITLSLQDASDGKINPPSAGDESLLTLHFLVKGNSNADGNSISLTFGDVEHTAYTDWDGNGYEACSALNASLGQTLYNGDIDIPTYTGELDIAVADNATDDYYRKGDGVFDMVVTMKNNFPAGQNTSGGDGEINNLFEIPSYVGLYGFKETPYLDFAGQTHVNGTKLCYAYQQYNASKSPNFHYSTDALTVLDTITFSFTDALYTPNWDDNTFDISWYDSGNNWSTEVIDITGSVALDYSDLTLTEEAPKVHTGLFLSHYVTDGDVTVSQPVYLKSTFDVGEFTVDVACDANATISSVTCYNGTSTSSVSSREKTIYYDGTSKFCDATGDNDSVHIATVNYRVVCGVAAKSGIDNETQELDGLGGGGGGISWYVTSAISFNDEEMEEYDGDDMFVDLAPSNIRGKCVQIQIEKFDDGSYGLPTQFALYPNRPNPFNPSTIIAYDLPEATFVNVEIINISGQKVATIVNEFKEAGHHEVTWNSTSDVGGRLASGIYFYKIEAGSYRDTKKMVLMK